MGQIFFFFFFALLNFKRNQEKISLQMFPTLYEQSKC